MKKIILFLGLIFLVVLVGAVVYQEPWIQNQLGNLHNLTNMGWISADVINGTTIMGTVTGEVTGSMNWTKLKNYPVACPGSSAITALNDSVTCSDLWVDVTGDIITGNLNVTGNINSSGNITTTGYGQFAWVDKIEATEPGTPPSGTLRLYVINQSGFPRYNYKDPLGVSRTLNDDEIIVKNIRGTTIAAHRFVYATGNDAGIPTVNLADASNISEMPAICVTIESIANGSVGRCMQSGLIENVNTNAYEVGTIYISATTPGIPTNTAPIIPNLTQEMGTILVKSTTVGKIQIISRALTGDEYGTINDFVVAGNLTILGNYGCFDSSCAVYIKYNGTCIVSSNDAEATCI